MDNDGPGIDPYTKVIPPDMVITHAYYDDRNIKSDSGRDNKPEDADDNALGVKELPGDISIYYASPEAKIVFLRDWGKLHMALLWSK